MFSYIKSKIKISGQYIKPFIILGIITLLYALLILFNTATMEFEFNKLKDTAFWVRYAIVICFSVIILLLSMVLRKDILKNKTLITNQLQYISTLRGVIVENGLYEEFRDVYLEEYNKKTKLESYRVSLLNKRDKAKDKATISKYDQLYKQSQEIDFDITTKNMKIKEVNVNLIFLGYNDRKGSKYAKYYYSGFENFAQKVVPSIFFGVVMAGILLAATLSTNDTSVQQWKDILSVISVSLSYLINGLVYADYSINEVYYSVLCNREDIIKSFLCEKGLVIYISPNPNNNYIGEIEGKKETGKREPQKVNGSEVENDNKL